MTRPSARTWRRGSRPDFPVGFHPNRPIHAATGPEFVDQLFFAKRLDGSHFIFQLSVRRSHLPMEGLGDHFSFGRWGFREQLSVERLAIAKVKSLSISNKCFRISIASFNLCVDFLNQLGSGHTRAGNDVGSGNRDLKLPRWKPSN